MFVVGMLKGFGKFDRVYSWVWQISSPAFLRQNPSPTLHPTAAGIATTPPAVRQSVFSAQQLAAVAASLSKLPNPRQSQHWLAAEAAAARAAAIEAEGQQQRQLEYEGRLQLEEREVEERRYRASQDAAQVAEVERQCRRASQRGSREQLHVSAGEAGRASGAANSEGQQLSGFTVYTNGLQTTEFVDSGDGEVAQQRPQRVSQPALRHSASAPASAAGGDLDSQGSGVQWRSISTAALSSHCRGSELGAGEEVAMVQQRGSRASSQQRREHQQRSSLEQLAADGWEDQQAAAAAEAGRLQQHARQLSKLVLPGLDASQLDSLVRIGASQQSPDPHRCPLSSVEVLQQLLPPGWQAAVGAQWDSGINPLQSDADAELLLRELRAEWQRQGAGTATTRPASRPGSRRVSQDGRPPVAQSMAAAVGQQERPTEQGRGRGMRAGSEPPGLLQVPMFDGKVAGAGTWVRWVFGGGNLWVAARLLLCACSRLSLPYLAPVLILCFCSPPALQPLAGRHDGPQEGTQPAAGRRRAQPTQPHQGRVWDHGGSRLLRSHGG